MEGLAAASADARDDRPPRLLVSIGASPSGRLTARGLFDNRRGEASRGGHFLPMLLVLPAGR
jgi:hypothetical protein